VRSKALLLAGLALALATPSADAALKRYQLYTVNITEAPTQNPNPNNTLPLPPGSPPFDAAFVDTSGPNPVLRKLIFRSDASTTINVPNLAVGIFLSNKYVEGPEATRLSHHQGVPSLAFTGTGSTANGSTIRWGTVTGWTLTGSTWCNSNPSIICALATVVDEVTVDPRFNSEFYDLGTWTFHGTGFTSIPWVHSYFTSNPGNNQHWLRGGLSQTMSVPALPLIGIAVLGSSIAVGGLAALRRRRS
jgi:hypothetical protein